MGSCDVVFALLTSDLPLNYSCFHSLCSSFPEWDAYFKLVLQIRSMGHLFKCHRMSQLKNLALILKRDFAASLLGDVTAKTLGFLQLI